jgi:hypothetical protein
MATSASCADELGEPRRILPCGMPRMDIGPAGVYGFQLTGDEVSVPRLFSRNH